MPDGRPERPTYTTGQYIGATDLNAAVDYNRDTVERLALSGRNWGIATGLALIERAAPTGGVQMFIEPGIAWDGYGRPIVVLSPAPVTPDLFAHLSSGTQPVWLRYSAVGAQAVAPGFQTCGAGDPFTRISESYAIEAGNKLLSQQTDGIIIGGATVIDPRDMLVSVDQNAAVMLDASAAHQTFPGDAARWLIPIGVAAWQAGPPAQFLARSPAQLSQSRRARRYVGAVAESVLAADGVLRLRDRQTDQETGKTDDDLANAAAIQDADIAPNAANRLVGNELVWVEGNMRVTGNARLFGKRLELRDPSGAEAGNAPMFLRRGVSANNSASGQDLQVSIGQASDGKDRLAIGVVKPPDAANPDGALDERVVIRTDGKMGIGAGTSATPRTTFDVRGAVAGAETDITQHLVILENTATANADVLALKVNVAIPDSTNNFITFFGASGPVGRIEGAGGGFVSYGTSGADFAEVVPRAAGTPPVGAGRIVGVHDGCVSLQTKGAEAVLVTTDRPAVIGNAPERQAMAGCETVALLGQVPVMVAGPVSAGDLILASGEADGVGRALPAGALEPRHLPLIVGRAWDNAVGDSPRRVNALVGPGVATAAAVAQLLAAQARTIARLSTELARLQRAAVD
jgi:hypothetical protein